LLNGIGNFAALTRATEIDLKVRVGELKEEFVKEVAQRPHSRLAAETV
jgi:hypothetical protein